MWAVLETFRIIKPNISVNYTINIWSFCWHVNVEMWWDYMWRTCRKPQTSVCSVSSAGAPSEELCHWAEHSRTNFAAGGMSPHFCSHIVLTVMTVKRPLTPPSESHREFSCLLMARTSYFYFETPSPAAVTTPLKMFIRRSKEPKSL